MMYSGSSLARLGLWTLALCAPAICGCGDSIHWERDYDTGIRKAAQLRRRALIEFTSTFSADSSQMDDEVFSDPNVQQLLTKFVAIRLDTTFNKRLADQWGVQVVPTFIVVRPDLTVAGTQSGRLDAEKFRYFLIKHTAD